MNVELLSVGTELLLGEILNTNTKYLSEELSILGACVYYQTTVGDNPERLKNAVETAFSRADMIIATGGLGPTQDDITKEVIAEFMGLPLEFDEESYALMKEYFRKNRRVMPESNKKQAMMPKGCVILKNTCGTAPGCIMEKDGKTAVILPGPPGEMKVMFENEVKKYLLKDEKIYTKNLRIFGMGESMVAEKLDDMISKGGKLTVAPYAMTGEVRLRIAIKAEEKEAKEIIDKTEAEIQKRLGDVIYSTTDKSLPETVVELLKEKKLTISSAESCTGGLFAKMITDVSGASSVLNESYVTYSPEAKMRILGVLEETITQKGIVSKETAIEMAEGVIKASKADVGVSFTGYAGPEGEKVGLVWMAVSYKGKTKAYELNINGNRERIRYVSALNAFDAVRRIIKDNVF